MIKKYGLKKTGLMTYRKVAYDEKNPFMFVIEDTTYKHESMIWVDPRNQSITYIDGYGLEIDSAKFNEIINQKDSNFIDLVRNSKNARVFRTRKDAIQLAKKYNYPWTSVRTPKRTRYIVIINPPKCCSLDSVQHKEPNNPFV